MSEVTGFVNTKYQDPNKEFPDIQFFFSGFLANCAKTGQVGERIDNNTRSIQIIPTVLHPKSRGKWNLIWFSIYISLLMTSEWFFPGSLRLKDNNPLSHPLIFANYYIHPDDAKVMVEGIKIGLKLAETKGTKMYSLFINNTSQYSKN